MTVTAASLSGVGRIPTSKPAALAWLQRHGVSSWQEGQVLRFSMADLPERRAWAERAGLEPGVHDEAASAAFLAAPASMRVAADRKATIARFLLTKGAGLSWADRASLVAERLGFEGVSEAMLRRVLAAVEGVDPINHAPALLAGHGTAAPAPAAMSDDAWCLFRGLIRDAGAEWPLWVCPDRVDGSGS